MATLTIIIERIIGTAIVLVIAMAISTVCATTIISPQNCLNTPRIKSKYHRDHLL